MLQIKNVNKQYKTGDLIQTALDDVNLNLRNNEFVAILGPSGSGKTTLLNIIGGLDRYDKGDLIINGISTKKYKDRDWDSYRNHTIGFVFQSYNLIPHQTILANVELALTISGVPKNKRKQKAIKALEQVGLAKQIYKKPNQLSGGQMQRVAIARALVNDPDIVLADEPTGALDSDTSIQVMELLKEVAKDRLVVMVTHNPELAENYATRIVNIKDGKILSDTNPYTIGKEEKIKPIHKNLGKTTMSFLTSLALSFNNLKTKKGRTILTSFASSIGIIGIALILSLSNGANMYIKSVEEDTLSEYPIQIQSTGIDVSSLLVGTNNEEEKQKTGDINVSKRMTNMFSKIGSNDLVTLKKYLESNESNIREYAKAVEYSYNITPIIYSSDTENIRKVNPDTTFSSLGMGAGVSSNSMMSNMMSTNVFFEMPKDSNLYESQYDIKAGKWPTNYNECVLVLTSQGNISDFLLYTFEKFDEPEKENAFDMNSLISIDTNAIKSAFKIDQSKIKVDFGNLNNVLTQNSLPALNMNDILSKIKFSMSQEDIKNIIIDFARGYEKHVNDNELVSVEDLNKYILEYMNSEEAKKIITNSISKIITSQNLEKQINIIMKEYMQNVMGTFSKSLQKQMTSNIQKLSKSLTNAISIDENAFMGAFKMKMDDKELAELFNSLMSKEDVTYEGNLKKLNYANLDNPSEISIYPKDFEGNKAITNLLNDYNIRMEESGQEDKAISYADMVGSLMSSITTIVDTISYVLIAFVAILLVVSSIIGGLAGIIGIGITLILIIPINKIIAILSNGVNVKASLPFIAGIILIVLSIVLTLIGGIIPSKKAAKEDPVLALRSE